MYTRLTCCLLLPFLIIACSLPEERLRPFELDVNYSETSDSITIVMTNPLVCPLRLEYNYQPINIHCETILESGKTWKIHLPKNQFELKDIIDKSEISTFFGTINHAIVDSNYRYLYPFPKGKSYQITQAYNGLHSHNTNYARYAIDLNLKIGDTISAARGGIVVGVIDGYEVGGNLERYTPYANQITIYHDDGTTAQYVHLQYQGSLVKVGDQVSAAMPIALSGNTGYIDLPQLHFNVLVPTEDYERSLSIKFLHIDGKAIKEGFTLSH